MNIHQIVCVIVVCLVPAQVLGWNPKKACPKTPADPVKAQMTAGELFAEAERDYQSSRPMKALKGFLCSHRIMPHENTLFNIVQIAKLAEHQESSIRLLKDFVKHVKGEHLTQPIEEVIDELEEGDLGDGNGAEEETSGATTQTDALDDTYAEGPSVLPEAATDDDSGVDSGVNAGENDAFLMSTQRQSEENDSRIRKLKVSGIVMMSVGGGALLAGGTFQWLSARSQQKAAETDNFSVFKRHEDKMNRFQTGAIISYISGGVIFGTGLIFTFLSRKKERVNDVQLGIYPGYRGFSLVGRF